MTKVSLRSNERGSIVVETTGSFILFVLLIISILSLVNIVTLQTRVHYALTQAAITLSIYSYALEVAGLADTLVSNSANAADTVENAVAVKADVYAVIDAVSSISGNSGFLSQELPPLNLDSNANITNNPVDFINGIMAFGYNAAGSLAFEEVLLRPLVGRYLSNGSQSGDEYLRSVNVINGLRGLDFNSLLNPGSRGTGFSLLLDEDANVHITVSYQVEYRFGALPLPFTPVLNITQSAVTKAWLGGHGTGYVRAIT